jgi:hypothetical protein
MIINCFLQFKIINKFYLKGVKMKTVRGVFYFLTFQV